MMDAFGCWLGLLIACQGHQDFNIRESATNCLCFFGDCASPWLEATRGMRDAEIVHRSFRLMDQSNEQWIDSQGKLPWIDAVPMSIPDRHLGVEYLIDVAPGTPQDWLGYRMATRNWLLFKIREGMSRRDVLNLLTVMRNREAYWWENRQYPPE